MKTKFSGILTLFLAFVVQLTFAQEKTISGTVSDASGLPLPGATVLVKGTTTGTSTDFDGKYSISASQGSTLVFSFVGYTTKEVAVGSSNTINVTMTEDAALLDEVVVTALGIKREKKSLGYSVQEVSGDEVNKVKDQSFISSLSGKVSGLAIKKSNSVGGSVNVVLRGSNSFTGNNQALFVVDGIPVSNSNLNGSTQASGGGGYDYGNAASDINPDDIESISVLKGATAAALYGSDAANGVILITTKKGTAKKGIGVTINNTTTASYLDGDTFPKYQKEYGAGYGGPGSLLDYDVDGDGNLDLLANTFDDASFGDAFDPNLMVYQWNSLYPQLDTYLQPTPWVAAKHGPETLFNTGVANIFTVALDGGNDMGTFRFSYTNNDRTGILPNSNIKKDIVDLSGSYKLNDKLTASAKATYTRVSGKGRYGTGYEDRNIVQNMRQWWETNVDLKQQRDAYFQTGENITWNPNGPGDLAPTFWDNPYFTLYSNYESDLRNRIIGKAQLDYELTDWLSALARFGMDSYSDFQEERVNVGSHAQSSYSKYNRTYEQYNYDFILKFNKDISDKLNINGLLGTSLTTRNINSTEASTNGGIVLPGVWALSNSMSALSPPTESEIHVRKLGYYAQLSFGYDNLLYLDGTFRVDESSTLPANNNVYTYPSVSTSFLFSNLLDTNWLDFAKLRLSYAEVANDAPSYSVDNTSRANDSYGGAPVYYLPDTSNNNNLKPESTKEMEAGLEAKLFKNRLGFDFSIYKKNTVDQILPVQVSTASGYNFKYVNAGEMENKGLEVSLYGTPVKTNDFEWNISANWAKNKNKVLSLFEDGENLLIYSAWSTAVNARKGEAYGSITGTDYVYTNGQKTVGADGKYLRTSSTTEVIGNIQPDWIGGISNTFKYKNWTVGFLIDVQHGGDVVNYDVAYGRATGLYVETAGLNSLGNPKRDPVSSGGGILVPGVTADGSPNTKFANAGDYLTPLGYYGGSGETGYYAPDAQFVFDASYVKLREASITYSFPKKILDRLDLTGLNIGLSGRNLWIIHKNLPYGDPESTTSSGNYQGIQNGELPSTRDLSLNVTLQF